MKFKILGEDIVQVNIFFEMETNFLRNYSI